VGAHNAAETPRLVGGRYELEVLVGKGGVGEVWRARHVTLNSRVAIKFLQMASADKESAKRRFTIEAQITAQLKSPHAVQVFDFGVTDEGQPYLVMELLEGETLGRRLERVKHLGPADTTRLLGHAARALHRAHALGIVHRDFKPDNIVVTEDDEGRELVKVLDFGVAKLLGVLDDRAGGDEDAATALERGAAAPSFTRTGSVLGTPLYMSPEQVRNPSGVDLKADIWAFGVVAYECLTGRPPFAGSTLAELFERIQSSQHASASFVEPGVPPAFDTWFDVACAPDPGKRFMNASVAWKQLTIALDTSGRDSSGSFPGLDSAEPSFARSIVVRTGEERTDATAATLEGAPGELLTRTRDEEFHSLRRIPLAVLASVPPPPPGIPPAATGPAPRPASRARAIAAVVAAAAVVGLVLAWREAVPHEASGRPDPALSAPVHGTASDTSASAIAPALATAGPAIPVAPAAASVSPPAPSSSHAGAHPPPSRSAPTTQASGASPSAPHATPEAPSHVPDTEVRPTAAPTLTAPAPDPGSYR
jgi:eukaryotic-like serine/threonine-protein kinase